MNQLVSYEFPLNERMRIFIRLEQLFFQFEHHAHGLHTEDKRAALYSLIDIASIFKRIDLKSEILKELDRHVGLLTKLLLNDDVDKQKVNDFIEKLTHLSRKFYEMRGKIGNHVADCDLFQSITQRSAIAGGACSFDLPEFHYWLSRDEETKLKDLATWRHPFDEIREAISLILEFIRKNAVSHNEIAKSGFFQVTLDSNLSHQLLIVSLEQTLPCFAEISGSRHRCSVRFLTPSEENKRPSQFSQDVHFLLTHCIF